MKSVQCSSHHEQEWPCSQEWPHTVPSSDQGWCFGYDWITGDCRRQWGWEGEKTKGCICVGWFMSVSLLFGRGECHHCHLVGSLCSGTRGVIPWVIVTSGGRGNCCVILTVSLPFPKLPWGDVPEGVTAPPDCLSERFPELALLGFEGPLVKLKPMHL